MKPPFHTLVCATDFSSSGDDATATAFALAGKGATVHLVHVSEPSFVVSPLDGTPLVARMPPPDEIAKNEEKAERRLKDLVPPDALARGVKAQTHVVLDSGVAGTLARVAKDVGADVVVIGTHGRKGLERLLMGSVANEVLRQSGPPVIVVRPALK
jgi:nucleotide-binding universal stress UspA family protein